MSRITGGGRVGKNRRRSDALKRLESKLENFKSDGKDKAARTTTRNGGTRQVFHAETPFQKEIERMEREIKQLKSVIF